MEWGVMGGGARHQRLLAARTSAGLLQTKTRLTSACFVQPKEDREVLHLPGQRESVLKLSFPLPLSLCAPPPHILPASSESVRDLCD